jgi:Ca-activated chloride channel family protein
MKHNVRLSHSLLAVETDHRIHLMLELVAPPAPESGHPPMFLSLVVDRSGSMQGEKLAVTKTCAKFLVTRLRPVDRIALVDFGSDVRLVSPAGPPDRERLLPAIDSIRIDGMTNLSGGWLKGLEECRRMEGDGTRRVLLLTDGMANQGITSQMELESMAANAQGEGVSTSTIGFGEGFQETLLDAMAEAGHGNAYFAAATDEVPAIFEQEFEGLASVVAQNVSVEIRPAGETMLDKVLNDYRTVKVPGGLQVELGDSYGEEIRRVVIELILPGVKEMGEREIASVVLRYVSVGDEIASHEITIPVIANLVEDGKSDCKPDELVAEEVLILKAAEARREATELAEQGRYDSAALVLEDVAADLSARALVSDRTEEITQDTDELRRTAELLRRKMYGETDKKRMHYERTRSSRSLHHKMRRLMEMKRRMEQQGRKVRIDPDTFELIEDEEDTE